MARAKRHYIPGQIWHITHRCHKREFLLKFAKDRQRWLQWLFEAKKRYGISILNYTVTSNHIHLLVVDDKERDIIPNSIQLIAGRTGQEFNQRKSRSGAFWEDRYHATAVETGNHLFQCLVYIDLNMVRTGVVKHPAEWSFCGYNEIQDPKRKNVLINYEKLRELLEFDTYDKVKTYHKRWVDDYLENGKNIRDDKWTKSIAVGSSSFIEKVKSLMGIMAIGRESIGAGESYQLREPSIHYGDHFGAKKNDIGPENTYYWNDKP
jgi:REP element-mobilizing transposase RayT